MQEHISATGKVPPGNEQGNTIWVKKAPRKKTDLRVVAILENQGVDYESVDVLDEEYNNGLRETLKKYSNWPTFPQIFINGELVGGCDILTTLYEKGELAGLVKQ
ncbi:hypothetical protein ACJIZ3_018985 [Penstemon smallii]|uniref:Glutaredoxin domain-containing protein n=1 Tax=Penstemon smallii TaxID=265156 RepID=A0ABD3T0G9_9LAMI